MITGLRTRTLYRLLLLVILGLATGCAGTFRTHVAPPGGYQGVELENCASIYTPAVCKEFVYTNSWINTYIEAGGNPSKLRSVVGALTIPAAALAAYYGVTGKGSSNRIAGLTIGSASAYAVGTFFGGTGKQAVYFQGARAMSCVQLASVPALVSSSTIENIRSKNNELEILLSELGPLTDLPASSAQAIATGQTMAKAARDYLAFFDSAPYEMRARTNAIAIKVDELLVEQEPSLESLMSLVGSLDDIADNLVIESVQPEKQDTAAGVQQAGLSPELLEINRKISRVQVLSEAIRQETSGLAERRNALASIEQCSPQAKSNVFTINPANASFTVEQGKSLELTIVDSSGFPSVTATSQSTNAKPLTIRGDALVLEIEGIEPTDMKGVSVSVRSATGRKAHSFQVIVTKPKAEPIAGKQGEQGEQGEIVSKAAKPLNDLEKEVFNDPNLMLGLQCALDMPDKDKDCTMGPKTREAMKEKLGTPDGAITEALRNAIDAIEITEACADGKLGKCGAAP